MMDATSTDIQHTIVWIVVPAIAVLIPGLLTLFMRPGPRLTSAMQHLAAGLIMAAVTVELVPETLKDVDSTWPAIAGYVAGLVMVFAIRQLSRQMDEDSPGGLLATVFIDVTLDGFLVGIALVSIAGTGVAILVGSLSVEVAFLVMATIGSLLSRRWERRRVILVVAAMSIATLCGGLLGFIGAGALPPAMLSAATAFGIAALVYLVVEELLVEAHKGNADTTLGSLMFFVGFGVPIFA